MSNTAVKKTEKHTNETIVPDAFRGRRQGDFRIPALKNVQRGVVYYTFQMTLEQLAMLTQVDKTYQTCNVERKGITFGEFIDDPKHTCLGSIMGNDRQKKATFKPYKTHADAGILTIPMSRFINVYDGQKRRFGYLAHLRNNPQSDLKVSFTLTQVSREKEIAYYLDHNGKVFSAPNAHRAIVSSEMNGRRRVYDNLTRHELIYEIVAGACDNLVFHDGPWKNFIVMSRTTPEQKKEYGMISTIGSFKTGLSAFITHLDKIKFYGDNPTVDEKSEKLYEIIDVFSRAWEKACPKIWRTPKNYVMHGTKGLPVMLKVMAQLWIDIHNHGRCDDLWTVDNLRRQLRKSDIIAHAKDWEVGTGKHSGNSSGFGAIDTMANRIVQQIRMSA